MAEASSNMDAMAGRDGNDAAQLVNNDEYF
jgi:hypothetical protein